MTKNKAIHISKQTRLVKLILRGQTIPIHSFEKLVLAFGEQDKGPSLYYVSKGTFSTIYADVGWVGQKKYKNVLCDVI